MPCRKSRSIRRFGAKGANATLRFIPMRRSSAPPLACPSRARIREARVHIGSTAVLTWAFRGTAVALSDHSIKREILAGIALPQPVRWGIGLVALHTDRLRRGGEEVKPPEHRIKEIPLVHEKAAQTALTHLLKRRLGASSRCCYAGDPLCLRPV